MRNDSTKVIEGYIKNLKETVELSTDQLLVEVLEAFLKIERKEYLDKEEKDKGNGFYPRAFQGLSRESLQLRIPRSRTGSFKPALMELVRRDEDMVKEFALDLYTKGLSSRDTEQVLERYFSKQISHTQIVELSREYEEVRKKWEQRRIESRYKIIFVDAFHIPLRRMDSYSQEAVMVFVGLREDNRREVLAYEVAPNESASMYEEVLEGLIERGLTEVDLFVADGLKGLPEAIHRKLPQSEFQVCTVHKKRNVLNKVRQNDKAEVASDLKEVFDLFRDRDDVDEGYRRVDRFLEKLGRKYENIDRYFKDRRYLFTYTRFEPEIRRYIYTTNSIENLNSRLRKAMRNKYSFKSWSSLKNFLFLVMMEFEEGVLMKYEVNQFRRFKKCYI
jgi:putative transposase